MRLATWMALAVFIASPVSILAGLEAAKDPKIFAAFSDLDLLRTSVELFRQRQHRLPTDAEGLAALASGSNPEIDKLPPDPWGHDYVYRLTAGKQGFEIYSSGHDGVDQHGAGDDVTTPDKSYRCMNYLDDCPLTPRWWQSHGPLIAFVASAAWLAMRIGRWIEARIRRERIKPA